MEREKTFPGKKKVHRLFGMKLEKIWNDLEHKVGSTLLLKNMAWESPKKRGSDGEIAVENFKLLTKAYENLLALNKLMLTLLITCTVFSQKMLTTQLNQVAHQTISFSNCKEMLQLTLLPKLLTQWKNDVCVGQLTVIWTVGLIYGNFCWLWNWNMSRGQNSASPRTSQAHPQFRQKMSYHR